MYSLYFYHDCCNFTVLFRQPAYYHLTKGKIPRSNSLYAHLLKNKQDIPHRIYNAGFCFSVKVPHEVHHHLKQQIKAFKLKQKNCYALSF